MNFQCPYCKKKLNLMEMQLEGDLGTIIRLQPFFGKNAGLVWAYIELFGITPMKAKAKKIRILLEEIKALLDAGAFSYKKKHYTISQAGIFEALTAMVRRNFEDALPNHNYLKSIMVAISEREGKAASVQAEKDLRQNENAARNTYRQIDESTRQENLQRVGSILKNMGER